MRPDILELVKELTKNDTKTLSQKSNKLFEEGGELAKCILPYESASGTLHRVVNKARLLEEVSDVLLVALSIAYELGYDDDSITSMMHRKSLYWAQIQREESKINPNKIPHEIHVTVESAVDIETFKADCVRIGVKPVVLDLHTKVAGTIKDVMTSQVVIGTTTDAFAAMAKTQEGLVELGYTVVRCKIEAAPWHPSAPTTDNQRKHSEHNYFESHVEVFVNDAPNSMYCMAALKEVLSGTDAHISNNFFKANNEIKTVMVTFRKYTGTLEEFKYDLTGIKSKLFSYGFEFSPKDIIEYSIYDSNTTHDKEWMNV